MIIGEENETKKVTRSRERKRTEIPPSQNVSKKSKLQSFYGKGISKFTSLQEALSTIDEEDESVRNVTVLLPESGDRDIPADEEDNFKDNSSFPTEVAVELEVHYNLTSETEGENETDGPTSSNRGRIRTATRNTTKNTTTSPETMNEDSECGPDDEDYVAQLPKRKPKVGAPEKTKTKKLCGEDEKKMTKEQKKNKWKSNATLFVLLEKANSINFHPKIEKIEGITPYETWPCLFRDDMFDKLVEQTQLCATRDKGSHNFYLTRSDIYQFIGILLFSGYHKVPKERDYWSAQIGLHVPFIVNAMTRNRYLQIKQYLHIADNRNLVEGSKVAKIKPLYDRFNVALKQFGILHDKVSIDESMVPYQGLHSICQYMKSKPIKFGYKIWSLCGNNGYPYHLDIFCGKSEGPGNEFGLGGKVVSGMVDVLKDMNDDDITNCEFFFDYYFTSYELMEKLPDDGILGTGTVKVNRISVANQILISKNALKKTPRTWHL